MSDTLTINGVLYRAVKEEKHERISGWIRRVSLDAYGEAIISINKSIKHDDTRMVELRDGEVIVSEDDFIIAWLKSGYVGHPKEFLKELGFKESGK